MKHCTTMLHKCLGIFWACFVTLWCLSLSTHIRPPMGVSSNLIVVWGVTLFVQAMHDEIGDLKIHTSCL